VCNVHEHPCWWTHVFGYTFLFLVKINGTNTRLHRVPTDFVRFAQRKPSTSCTRHRSRARIRNTSDNVSLIAESPAKQYKAIGNQGVGTNQIRDRLTFAALRVPFVCYVACAYITTAYSLNAGDARARNEATKIRPPGNADKARDVL
jgi:hypothetical protein